MIIVFGSTNLDQIGTVPRLPQPGETVIGGLFTIAPGGKGANQALAARRGGRTVRHAGAVGDDVFAAEALALLRADGVDLTEMKTSPGPTGIGMIMVDENGENAIAVLPGANASLTEADAERALAGLAERSIVLLQEEIPEAANRRALELARAGGATSLFNTAPWRPESASLARRASVVIANETEFAMLTGSAPAARDDAMLALARTNDQTVIVTMGAEGAVAAAGGQLIRTPAPSTAAVDTVGAGDTFCGYLAAGFDAGLELHEAMRRATMAASLACLTRGAQPSIPWAADVDAALVSTR